MTNDVSSVKWGTFAREHGEHTYILAEFDARPTKEVTDNG